MHAIHTTRYNIGVLPSRALIGIALPLANFRSKAELAQTYSSGYISRPLAPQYMSACWLLLP